MTDTPEYIAWRNMVRRCTNPSDASYHRYGGRGVTVCDEWLDPVDGPRRFFEHIGARLDVGYQLDRINNAGNYEPGNVRWVTPSQNCRNKHNNTLLTRRGKTRTLAEWGEIVGINPVTITGRLERGWTIARALTEPAATKAKPLTKQQIAEAAAAREHGATWVELGSVYGVAPNTVSNAIARAAGENPQPCPADHGTLTFNGKTKPTHEWAGDYGIPRTVLTARLRADHSPEAALTTPVRKKRYREPVSDRDAEAMRVARATGESFSSIARRFGCSATTARRRIGEKATPRPEGYGLITIDGVTRPLHEWARLHGVNRKLVSRRISGGMSPSEALKPLMRKRRPGVDVVREMARQRADGSTWVEIGKRFGFNENSVAFWVKELHRKADLQDSEDKQNPPPD